MLDVSKIVILAIAGLLVLVSYYIVFFKLYKSTKSYMTHDFWFGIDTTVVKMLMFFQILAVIGFLMCVIPLVIDIPKSGVLSEYLFAVILTFFISAIIWPFATYYKMHVLVVVSLLFTAFASILLLAGSIEDTKPKWYIVLGALLLCNVTVLGDGVLWNANYIYKLLHK